MIYVIGYYLYNGGKSDYIKYDDVVKNFTELDTLRDKLKAENNCDVMIVKKWIEK